MRYQIGYLYQSSKDGQHWANGHGPVQRNLRVVSAHSTRAEAIAAGVELIGSPAPMGGEIIDAYLCTERGKLIGEIRKDGTCR